MDKFFSFITNAIKNKISCIIFSYYLISFPYYSHTQIRFAVVSDMQFAVDAGHYQSEYFWGVCQAIELYQVDFMVSPGDVNPADSTEFIINYFFGNRFNWYPIAGNHDYETYHNRAALENIIRKIPNIKIGYKPMVYSFDIQQVHFSCLDLYSNSTESIINDQLLDWLAADLAASRAAIKIVVGHEPAFVLPDLDCGRLRYQGNCLDRDPMRRDQFWQLLKDHQVLIYLCGHTHNLSIANIQGVWQVNAGHARGVMETEAPSTFLIFEIDQEVIITDYRDQHDGIYDYNDLSHTWRIAPGDVLAPDAPLHIQVKKTR